MRHTGARQYPNSINSRAALETALLRDPTFRPNVLQLNYDLHKPYGMFKALSTLIELCWSRYWQMRPTFEKLERQLFLLEKRLDIGEDKRSEVDVYYSTYDSEKLTTTNAISPDLPFVEHGIYENCSILALKASSEYTLKTLIRSGTVLERLEPNKTSSDFPVVVEILAKTDNTAVIHPNKDMRNLQDFIDDNEYGELLLIAKLKIIQNCCEVLTSTALNGDIVGNISARNILLNVEDYSVQILKFSFHAQCCVYRNHWSHVAPELLKPGATFNEASDVYAFGVTMNEILFGVSPPIKRADLIANSGVRPPLFSGSQYLDRNAGLCKLLSSMISMCWSGYPECRPTFSELNSFFESFIPSDLFLLDRANVAIVGSSGAGKTSFVKCIIGGKFDLWQDLRTRVLEVNEFSFQPDKIFDDDTINATEINEMIQGEIDNIRPGLKAHMLAVNKRREEQRAARRLIVRFFDFGGDNGYDTIRATIFNKKYIPVTLRIVIVNGCTCEKIFDYLKKWIRGNKIPTLVVITHATSFTKNVAKKSYIIRECKRFFDQKGILPRISPLFVDFGSESLGLPEMQQIMKKIVTQLSVHKLSGSQRQRITTVLAAIKSEGYHWGIPHDSELLKQLVVVINREDKSLMISSSMFTEVVKFTYNPIKSLENEIIENTHTIGNYEKDVKTLQNRLLEFLRSWSMEGTEYEAVHSSSRFLEFQTTIDDLNSKIGKLRKKVECLENAVSAAAIYVHDYCGLTVFVSATPDENKEFDVAIEEEVLTKMMNVFWPASEHEKGSFEARRFAVMELRQGLVRTHFQNLRNATSSIKMTNTGGSSGSTSPGGSSSSFSPGASEPTNPGGSSSSSSPGASKPKNPSRPLKPKTSDDEVLKRKFLDLQSAIRGKKLTDLHTHLTGMGSHEFWMEGVMCYLIPNLVSRVREACEGLNSDQVLAKKFEEISYRIMSSHFPNKESDSSIIVKELEKKWEKMDGNHDLLTIDVVYSTKILLQAMLGYNADIDEMSHDPEPNDHITTLEKFLSNSVMSHMAFANHYKRYIVYDVKEGKFIYVTGLTNSFLVEAMEWQKRNSERSERARAIIAKIRNCFSMLNVDGSEPRMADLDGFRGNFTPYFYPMRYLMKDPMYQQIPFILSYLLNHVCYRYSAAGVGYVEFSAGIGDLFNEEIHKFLNPKIAFGIENNDFSKYCCDWNSGLFGIVDYKFLIGIARTKTIFGSKPRSIRRKFVSLYGPLYIELLQNRQIVVANDEVDRFLDVLYLNKIEVICQNLSIICNRYDRSSDEQLCVGLDFNGEEDGNPFSIFAHSKVLEVIKLFREKNGKFGVRLHAGEAVVRGSSVDVDLSREETLTSFYTHLQVIAEEMQHLASFIHLDFDHDSEMPVSIRIGHGLAFLPVRTTREHDIDLSVVNNAGQYYNDLQASLLDKLYDVNKVIFGLSKPCWIGLRSTMGDFRNWLVRHKVVFEVNLTSNHTLLSDVFCTEIGQKSEMYVQSMLHNKFTVILSTDDDGIWPIQPCKRHKCHISVAKEYCKALAMLTKQKIFKWDELKKQIELLYRNLNNDPLFSLNYLVWSRLRKEIHIIMEKNEVTKWLDCRNSISTRTTLNLSEEDFIRDLAPLIEPSVDWKSVIRLLAPLSDSTIGRFSEARFSMDSIYEAFLKGFVGRIDQSISFDPRAVEQRVGLTWNTIDDMAQSLSAGDASAFQGSTTSSSTSSSSSPPWSSASSPGNILLQLPADQSRGNVQVN